MSDRALVSLGEIADITVGFAFKSNEYASDGGGTRLLRGDNIAQGHVRWSNAERWPAGARVDERYHLRNGDIVVAMDRPWIEAGLKFAVLRADDVPALLVQRVARLRARPGTDQGYLAHLIEGHAFTEHVKSVQTGTSIPHISGRQISEFRIKPHPLAEQRAIAEVLGALDDKIAANTKLAETADVLAEAIYDSSVSGLPTQPMSAMLQPVLGGTPARAKAEYWNGSRLWISAKDVTGAPGGVVIDTEEKITDLAESETKAKPLREGSVIITARGTVGAVARLAVPASFNQSCYGFEPRAVPPSVLYMAILRATERAKAVAHGSVFDTITMRTFDHLGIPRFHEGAAAQLEDRLRPVLDSVVACVKENRALAATRDALLPQLMSGKLRVQDAEKVAAEVV